MVNEYDQDELAELRKQADLFYAYEALKANPNFVKLIAHYTGEYQNSLVDSLATTTKLGESTVIIDNELKAISFFKYYLNQISTNGNSAIESLELKDD